MSKPENHNYKATFSDNEVAKIVSKRLPQWKTLCDSAQTDKVILSQKAFGESPDEVLLLACAIKYAGIAQTEVTIIP